MTGRRESRDRRIELEEVGPGAGRDDGEVGQVGPVPDPPRARAPHGVQVEAQPPASAAVLLPAEPGRAVDRGLLAAARWGLGALAARSHDGGLEAVGLGRHDDGGARRAQLAGMVDRGHEFVPTRGNAHEREACATQPGAVHKLGGSPVLDLGEQRLPALLELRPQQHVGTVGNVHGNGRAGAHAAQHERRQHLAPAIVDGDGSLEHVFHISPLVSGRVFHDFARRRAGADTTTPPNARPGA
ncbi:hypothetical protein GCG21_09835 [Pseudactinotalea sp. HY160]|nr:hypothetical protein [Pseudactinotalea sp. HY160]